jgi:N-acetylneuraminate synthase
LKILSYGYQGTDKKVSSFQEFEDFYQTSQAKTLLQEKVSILHCTTNYPAALDEINLRAMETIRKQFDLPVGYSDHTDGMLVPVAAVAAGAIIIEKHFTTDCDLPGPDHKASIEPEDFKEMISLIRQVETALGNNIKTPTESELNIQKVACKKIVAAKTILAGEIITEDAITTKRTGEEGGLVAHKYWDILGLRAKEGIKQDQTITPDVLG